MKKNAIFEKFLANVPKEIQEEVSLNIDIANRIYDLLKSKKMTQRKFAALMGKRESEISRWLSGTHGFTTATLAKIAAVLGEPIVVVKRQPEVKYVFYPIMTYSKPSDVTDGVYTNIARGNCVIKYNIN